MPQAEFTTIAELGAAITDPQIASLVEEPSVTRTALDGRYAVADNLPAQLDAVYARADSLQGVVAGAVANKADLVAGAIPAAQIPEAVKPKTGVRPVGINEEKFNPYDFKTGTMTDQQALDACYAAAVSYLSDGGLTDAWGDPAISGTKWAAIVFPKGVMTGNLDIQVMHLSVRSHGGALKGTVEFGRKYSTVSGRFNTADMLAECSGMTFIRPDAVSGVYAPMVRVNGARRLRIHSNTFMGNVYGDAIELYSGGNTDGQTISQIRIENNDFRNVRRGVYAPRVNRPGTSTPEFWGHLADIIVHKNICRNTTLSFLDVDCTDGIFVTNNQIFFVGQRQGANEYGAPDSTLRGLKEDGIIVRGDESNFVVVENNKVYGPGRDGVYIENSKNVTVVGNEIVWPGQRLPGSGVHLHVTGNSPWEGNIQGNTVAVASKSIVHLSSSNASAQARGISVGVNHGSVWNDGSYTYYYGDFAALPATFTEVLVEGFASAPRVYTQTRATSAESGVRGMILNAKASALVSREGDSSMVTVIDRARVLIPLSTQTPLVALCDVFGGAATWSGDLIVTITPVTDVGKSATYKLFVGGLAAAPNTAYETVVVAKVGAHSGTAATDPSFDFNVNASTLRAVPKSGVGGGEFFVTVRATGNIMAYRPPQAGGALAVTGTVKNAETITATAAGFNASASLSYQWYRTSANVSGLDQTISFDYVPVSGATSNTYGLTSADVGRKLYCLVTSRYIHFHTSMVRSSATAVVAA